MKTQIKASQIKIGDHVLDNTTKVVADDYDVGTFILGDEDSEDRKVMNRLASDFATYVDILMERSYQSLAKFQDKAKTSLASAITWKAEEALIDEFIYNEISELVAKLVALDSPEDARDAVLRVVNYERDSFLDHYRTPNGSNWTSNGVKNAENAARQQMLRNDGEAHKPIMAIIDDFITKEIA